MVIRRWGAAVVIAGAGVTAAGCGPATASAPAAAKATATPAVPAAPSILTADGYTPLLTMGPANIEVTFSAAAAYVTGTSGGFNDSGREEFVVVMDAAGVDLFGGPDVAVGSLQAAAHGAASSVTSQKTGSRYVFRVNGPASALAPLTASLPPAAHG